MKTYDVIITDLPWSYYGSTHDMGDVGKEYKTMTDEEIFAFSHPLSPRGVLFLWATCPRLDTAIEYIRRQGLHYRGVAFVWVKTKKDGRTPIGAQGVRPSVVKPTTELVLVASNVKKGRPISLGSESISQIILAPRTGHSRKPEEVQNRIELLYPNATKAEFFARRHRQGWDCFGDELPEKDKNHDD